MATAVALTRFGGEAPKISPQLLPDGYAQYALNAKLTSGDLVPYRQGMQILNVPASVSNPKTIYPLIQNSLFYWNMWTDFVDVAKSQVANITTQRIVYTGDSTAGGIPKETDINRAAFPTTSTHAVTYTLLAGDFETTLNFTVGSTVLNLLAVATAANQFAFVVENTAASGNVTVTPNGSEKINGASTLVVAPGLIYLIKCNGTAWTGVAVSHYPYDWYRLGVPAPISAPVQAYNILAKATTYTTVAGDSGKTLQASATPWTLTLGSAVTAGATFVLVIQNIRGNGGVLTIDPRPGNSSTGSPRRRWTMATSP